MGVSASRAGETARVIRQETEIRGLSPVAHRLRGTGPNTLKIDVFLASVDRKLWNPIVVAVSRGAEIIGLAYFKERRIVSFGTGILYGDATLNDMVLSSAADRAKVFYASIRAVLQQRGVRALRLLVPPDGVELTALRQISESGPVECTHAPGENHWSLFLPDRYESFLESLGQKTRRNFRYYRRRFEQAGHQYVESIDPGEFACAAYEFLGKSVVGAAGDGIARALRIFAAVDRPLLVGLRHRDGTWLSIVGGWYESDSLVFFFQMNDDTGHAEDSLSLVMRAYVIENMIAQNIRTLRFWAGIGAPLRRSCVPVPAVKVFLDKPYWIWSSFRALLRLIAPLLPKRTRWIADWIGSADQCSLKG